MNLGPDKAQEQERKENLVDENAGEYMLHVMLIGFFFKDIFKTNNEFNAIIKGLDKRSFNLKTIGDACDAARAKIFKALDHYEKHYKEMVQK